ncbi:hypothetical protein D3C77_74410 [compost metagenome]
MGAFRSQAGKLEDILGDEGHAVLLACQELPTYPRLRMPPGSDRELRILGGVQKYSMLHYWLKVLSATPLRHPPRSMHATV